LLQYILLMVHDYALFLTYLLTHTN